METFLFQDPRSWQNMIIGSTELDNKRALLGTLLDSLFFLRERTVAALSLCSNMVIEGSSLWLLRRNIIRKCNLINILIHAIDISVSSIDSIDIIEHGHHFYDKRTVKCHLMLTMAIKGLYFIHSLLSRSIHVR